jgi:hypothetical protein
MSAIDWPELIAAIEKFGREPVRTDEGLRLRGEGGFEALISYLPAPRQAAELEPIGVLLAESLVPAARVPGLAEPGASRRAAPALNRFAGGASAIPDGDGLRFAARATLYRGDEAFFPVHALMLAYAAIWGPTTALAGAERMAIGRPPNATGASAWTPDDFSEARARLPPARAALLDPPSPHALTANVPLGGARQPARVEIRADIAHPLHGPGLFASVVMPIRFRDEVALATAISQLNAVETEPLDAPPHYGAWAPAPGGRAAYVFFLPNAVRLPIIAALFGWMSLRAPLAAAALSAAAPG